MQSYYLDILDKLFWGDSNIEFWENYFGEIQH
jgi:hypothetical protein